MLEHFDAYLDDRRFHLMAAPRSGKIVLSEFRAAADLFVQSLRTNQSFRIVLLTHPWLRSPNSHIDEILDDPWYACNLVVFLNAVGEQTFLDVLHILGLPHKRIPALDLEWLEILLSHCLHSDTAHSPERDALFKLLRHDLHSLAGAFQKPSERIELLEVGQVAL